MPSLIHQVTVVSAGERSLWLSVPCPRVHLRLGPLPSGPLSLQRRAHVGELMGGWGA